MSVLFDGLIGPSYKPFRVMVCETARGMLMREQRLIYRVKAGEVSHDFIREIAESTLPFQNVANLLENVISLNEWSSKNVNLKSMCEQIIKACNKVADPNKPPATGWGEGEFDVRGWDVKRYPHTYECILHPHMSAYYKKHDTYEEQGIWEKRVRVDGYPFVMERRVKEALAAKAAREVSV